jgi:hypothetical protein
MDWIQDMREGKTHLKRESHRKHMNQEIPLELKGTTIHHLIPLGSLIHMRNQREVQKCP